MTAPAGYRELPDDVKCQCFNLWHEPDGSLWCCKGPGRVETLPPKPAVIPLIHVEIEPPLDRSEFWRDVEATKRIANPDVVRAFLGELIRVRAWHEADEMRQGPLTRVEYEMAYANTVEQLTVSCHRLGYFDSGRIMNIEVKVEVAA